VETGSFCGFDVDLRPDGITVVTFAVPDRLNALTRAAKRDLIETLLQAQMDDRVRVIVFTGAGRAFVAGDELDRARQEAARPRLVAPLPYGELSALRTYESLRSASQLLTSTIHRFGKFTIAAVNGHAIQSGLSIALASDLRIASSEARLGSATLRYGFLPDEGGHWLLARQLGEARAMQFLLRNKIIPADEALDLGLVDEVVAPSDLMATALARAAELAAAPQVAARLLKQAVRNAMDMSLEQALDDVASKTAISDHHPDAVEGRTAFHEKRPPAFNQWLET
jgi:2-(1,2-epoxy-1,2-dihydrophenyl)acetyl-CoA isomerase